MPRGICPECEAEVQVDEDTDKGDVVQCPDCGSSLEVVVPAERGRAKRAGQAAGDRSAADRALVGVLLIELLRGHVAEVLDVGLSA